MEDNKITREVYKTYADKIVSVLDKEGFYEQFKKRVEKGSSVYKLTKKRLIQDISIDWIDTIESVLPNLDTIVRNPRKFIVQEEVMLSGKKMILNYLLIGFMKKKNSMGRIFVQL